jgi:hypothetical protein
MEKNVNELLLERDQTAKSLVNMLFDNQENLDLGDSYLYFSFPLYKEDDDSSTRVNVLLFSDNYGITLFECANIICKDSVSVESSIEELTDKIEQTFSQVYSRFIKSKLLRRSPVEIKFPINQVLYLHNLSESTVLTQTHDTYVRICTNLHDLYAYFASIKLPQKLEENLKREALAVLEGSKGICPVFWVRLSEGPFVRFPARWVRLLCSWPGDCEAPGASGPAGKGVSCCSR